MSQHAAQFRFYEELNDFIPPSKRKRSFLYHFNGNPGIKDAIEAIGVPHTEVELILVNSQSVGFDYHLKPNDYVSVYPVFEGLDISPLVKLREKPLRESRFVLDVHLGKLASLLRMLGFDTLYRSDFGDQEIVRIGVEQKRIILTRDRQLLHAKIITHGYWIRSTQPEEQIREVIRRFDLYSQIKPFRRCIACNGELAKVSKEKIATQLKPKTAVFYDDFQQCGNCGKIYWKGSHFKRMQEKIKSLLRGQSLQSLRRGIDKD